MEMKECTMGSTLLLLFLLCTFFSGYSLFFLFSTSRPSSLLLSFLLGPPLYSLRLLNSSLPFLFIAIPLVSILLYLSISLTPPSSNKQGTISFIPSLIHFLLSFLTSSLTFYSYLSPPPCPSVARHCPIPVSRSSIYYIHLPPTTTTTTTTTTTFCQ